MLGQDYDDLRPDDYYFRSVRYNEIIERIRDRGESENFEFVHCRIGSLEDLYWSCIQVLDVHCRIGSLEDLLSPYTERTVVHCRIGSLEVKWTKSVPSSYVHCRIGSLEEIHDNHRH